MNAVHALALSRRRGARPGAFPGRGFTLLELMVVVSLAALMLTLGVPALRDLINAQRVRSATVNFSNAVVLARSEAIKRNANVVLQAMEGGWSNGWLVKQADTVLARQDALSGVSIASPAPLATALQITYQSNGRLLADIDGLQFSDEAGGHVRCISFDLSGLPRSRQGSCA